ncbi:MAG: DNA topoisomerase 1 [Piccolia ochrophora]|nr:MAG: DNA topoisomerase 1 [Piccolia ochrophora]
MSSSDDDTPLFSGHSKPVNSSLSKESIPKSLDRAMDDSQPSMNGTAPGISIRNGPVDEMDVDIPERKVMLNGAANGKRKSRQSLSNGVNYKEASSEDDVQPLNKKRRVSGNQKQSKKDAQSDSDSDDQPLVRKGSRAKKPVSSPASIRKPPKISETALDESSDSDAPISAKLAKEKAKIERRAEQDAKAIRNAEKPKSKPSPASKGSATRRQVKEESDSDLPISKTKKGKASSGSTGKNSASNGVSKSNAKSKANNASPAKSKGTGKSVKRGESPDDEEALEEEEEYRWWDDPTKGDGTIKWNTLQHNGVVFPPPYESLPSHVRMKYDKIPVSLHPDAEEVAGFFGAMLNSTHNVERKVFCDNFFQDFQQVLSKTGGAKDKEGKKVKIKDFYKCDFKPMFDYYEEKRLEKKAIPAAEKKRLKAEKDEVEAQFTHCQWNGRKEKVGNFRVEPPGLFRGRGEHPKTGRVKQRVQPEQITINIGKEAKVPSPPPGHKWKEIKHDQTGTWLAMWQENINGAYKYVMLAANSTIKGQSDFKKFEKARELKKHIHRIRLDYKKQLRAELMADRQKATAVYLIDEFALRAGNEKGDDEADTVGCCSLKFENVTLKPPNKVIFDFLGKDSIRFYDEVEVDDQVFKNLKIFKKAPKKEGDEIFDRLKTAQLNQHLANYMQGLTAKVFRTYNASYTMSNLLQDMKSTGTIPEKVRDYNEANRKVAILCNHKRTVAPGHAGQMEKLGDKIKGLKYQKWRTKQMILDIDPKMKKRKGAAFFELDNELDDEWIKQHQAYIVEEQQQKIRKKFEKENEKLVSEGQKELKPKELDQRLEVATDLEKKFKKENKTKKVEAEGRGPTVAKMEANCEKIEQRIENMLVQAEDKENNKEVALGTSKINYIDPRLTVVFSKKFDVPIERFFSKTLREKFDWAIKSVDENWVF